VEDVARSAGAIVFGTNAHTFLTDRMVFSSGRMFSSPGEIVVGDGLAPQLHARIGSTITVAHRRMRVVGIYHLGVAYQDTGRSSRWRPLNRSAVTPAKRRRSWSSLIPAPDRRPPSG
jgi:hypothetical protein